MHFNQYMKQNLLSNTVSRCLCAGALLCSATLVSAQTLTNAQITFQVDMTYMVGNGFTPGTDTVSAHGSFNGWGVGVLLTTNASSSNPYLYSGTTNDTAEANGTATIFKYVIDNSTYETTADANNRCGLLPAASGATLALPVVFFNDDGPVTTANITFQVDMSEQINLGNFDTNVDSLYSQGSFEGWNDTFPLTNNPAIATTNYQGIVTSNVYVGTYALAASPGAAEEFKYVIFNGTANEYESPSAADGDRDNNNNRFFASIDQTLPIVYYSDQRLSSSVTNYVKFEADMSVQEALGTFTNGNPLSVIQLHGDFDSWDSNGVDMTNDPGLNNTNIFVADIEYVDPPGTVVNYKYVLQPGTQWENVPGGGNRQFALRTTNASYVVGPDFFSFEGPSALDDVVYVTNCMVTFTVDMTNAVGTDGTVFNGSGLPVYINGINGGNNNSFWTWGVLNAPAQFQMTEIGDSSLYTVTVPVNRGQNIDLVYKYSIDGNDNEAGFADNHTRYIRSQPNYTMPVDVFGSQGAASSSEPSFGDLSITTSGNQVSISWLGRQYVHLQTATSLDAHTVWTPQIATDGTNLIVAPGGIATTNYTIGAGNLYFELVYP
jgi:hypothetical protein